MKEVNYKQGSTKVWSDGDKIVITNHVGMSHIEANVDQIFDIGEYAKIFAANYTFEEKKTFNPHSRDIEIISGYIPQRVIDDLAGETLVSEYFK